MASQDGGDTGRPLKLLIVDDEEKICRMLEQHFSLKGYEARAVRRGEEALALSRAFQPDVVILDLLMPGLSGADTLTALKQLNPAPRVLVLSAANMEEVAQRTIQLGADFYLCKPVKFSELDHLVAGFSLPA